MEEFLVLRGAADRVIRSGGIVAVWFYGWKTEKDTKRYRRIGNEKN